MNLIDAENAAHRLVAHHLPGQGWRIRWNNNRGNMGVCKHDVRTLEFSALLFKHIDVEEAIDTITHEIAHALMGPGHGHSAAWAAKHREIGGSGRRGWSNPEISAKTAKWSLTCQGCGHVMHRNRLSKSMQERGCWHPPCGRVNGQMIIRPNA